jgi:hypothetical protein
MPVIPFNSTVIAPFLVDLRHQLELAGSAFGQAGGQAHNHLQ